MEKEVKSYVRTKALDLEEEVIRINKTLWYLYDTNTHNKKIEDSIQKLTYMMLDMQCEVKNLQNMINND